jgi:hypothetical protein
VIARIHAATGMNSAGLRSVQIPSRSPGAAKTRFISSAVSEPSLRSSLMVEKVCTCCRRNAPGLRNGFGMSNPQRLLRRAVV